MVDQISINGSPTEFESLSVSLPAGTGGPTASISLVAGLHLIPRKGDKIEFSIGGLTWNKGICDSSPATYEGKTKVVSVSVLGVQHLLDRKVTYDGGPATMSEILTELFDGSGVAAGIRGTEPEDEIFFPFEGKLLDAVEQLQTRTGGFLAWITPDGDFYLINPDDGHIAHELPWTGGTGYTLGQLQDLSGLQKTRFRVTGRNPKANLGDPDSLDYSQVYGGDGISTKFEYDPRVTEVVAVYVDATQQGFVPEGSAQQGTVDCYNSTNQSAVIFNTAPAEGTTITIGGVIDQATAELDDNAAQTALVSAFGGDGVRLVEESHPELITQADCDAYAEGMKLRYGKKMKELTAEVWKNVALYLPSNKVPADDGLGFSAVLPVQNCTAAREGGKWIQQVTIGDGPPGGKTTPAGKGGIKVGGGFRQIAQRLRQASLPAQPAAPPRTIEYFPDPPLFGSIQNIAFSPAGVCFIADNDNYRVRRIGTGGILSTIAGTGDSDDTGDGGPATDAAIRAISLKMDSGGNLIVGSGGYYLRKIDTDGIITTIAGTGVEDGTGDGGAATAAAIYTPTDVAINSSDEIFICSSSTNLRFINGSGIIDSVLDGSSAPITSAGYMGFDAGGGDLYFSDSTTIYKLSGGVITTIAGTGTAGYTGDGGPATSAEIFGYYLCLDDDGNIYFSQANEHVIRKIDTGGTITTIAGTGTAGYSGNGGPAEDAELNSPLAIAYHDGTIYFGDQIQSCIRKINLTTGIISLFAGTPGQYGFGGDGGPAAP